MISAGESGKCFLGKSYVLIFSTIGRRNGMMGSGVCAKLVHLKKEEVLRVLRRLICIKMTMGLYMRSVKMESLQEKQKTDIIFWSLPNS